MATSYQVVVYGASGYTGKLVAWKLARRGIPFIAAGRNAERLRAEMAAIPELAGHDYQCVGVRHDVDALTQLFKGKQVVLNIVGPFMQLGEPVVRAALEAGCHYFDTTGETDWMLHLKQHYAEPFARKELALCPANSYMWTEGAIAAEIALETPGIDTLDLLYYGDSQISVASTMSFLRMCTKPMYHLQGGQLVQWPWATTYDVAVPGVHRILKAMPWGGAGEPVWYQGDARVRNCSVLFALGNQAMFMQIAGLLQQFEAEHRHLDAAAQEAVTNAIGQQVTQVEPPRETPEVHRAQVSCLARGNTQSVSVVLRGSCAYSQTGVFAAEAAMRVLHKQLKAVGFGSGAAILGARQLLAAQADEGYLSYEITRH
ncbi:trans-acting enoyl reductase family protein [Aquabacterium sp.]|uniref:saccharopine dehydrogenase family protein n=1 Tax=Aquabacterium sp. TaxID=1872578 RepID=UPI0035B31AB5